MSSKVSLKFLKTESPISLPNLKNPIYSSLGTRRDWCGGEKTGSLPFNAVRDFETGRMKNPKSQQA